jgi:hypothetical protein
MSRLVKEEIIAPTPSPISVKQQLYRHRITLFMLGENVHFLGVQASGLNNS